MRSEESGRKDLCQLKDLVNLEVLDVKQIENADRDRPAFENRYYKILYFFLKEGIIPTLRKFYAHKQEQRRYLTFLFTRINQKRFLNVSVQSQTNSDDFVISNQFYECDEVDPKLPGEEIETYLERYNQFCTEPDYAEFGLGNSPTVSYDLKPQTFTTMYDKGLFIFGLGGYVRMFIIQHFKKIEKIACVDYKAKVTDDFQKRYRFRHGFLIPERALPLLKNVKEPIAIIATYHSDHASLAKKIFQSNPNSVIFIEKPPTVTLDDLDAMVELYKHGAKLEIGFNRRHIAFSKYVRESVSGKRVIISCSVKEVNISPNHWYFWKNQGTRVTGNVVHWFDLGSYWIQSNPIEINVISSPDDMETSAIAVLYKDGSVLNISASDRGNSLRGVQEKIELRYNNETIFIDDFNSLSHLKKNGIRLKKRELRRKKGHVSMYKEFKRQIDSGKVSSYTVDDLIKTSLVTYYASYMLQNGIRSMNIEDQVNEFLNRVSS